MSDTDIPQTRAEWVGHFLVGSTTHCTMIIKWPEQGDVVMCSREATHVADSTVNGRASAACRDHVQQMRDVAVLSDGVREVHLGDEVRRLQEQLAALTPAQ